MRPPGAWDDGAPRADLGAPRRTSEARRLAHASHLAATERRFYEEREAGVQDVVEWYELHADDLPWDRAVGLYIRMLSAPQLFIEGNHRTGALVMSWVLLRDGQPPFVLTADNAADYFRASTLAPEVPKHGLWASIRAAGSAAAEPSCCARASIPA